MARWLKSGISQEIRAEDRARTTALVEDIPASIEKEGDEANPAPRTLSTDGSGNDFV